MVIEAPGSKKRWWRFW